MSKQILVPLDSSPVSRDVIQLADQWANLFDASLVFLQVNPVQRGEGDQELLESVILDAGVTASHREVSAFGNPAQEILEQEKIIHPWLIMMAAHSHTLMSRLFLGSNTEYLINLSKTSVFVYRRAVEPLKDVVLVPIDYTQISTKVVQWADDIALKMNLALHFIHVHSLNEYAHYNMEHGWAWDQAETLREEEAAAHRLEHYLAERKIQSPFTHELSLGKPYEQIMGRQRQLNARLICMGAHEHTILERILMGSTTKYLLHHTNCPMLVYKQ